MVVDKIKAEYRYYSNIATAFVGRKIGVVDVRSDEKNEVGYTSASNYIAINRCHEIMNELSDEKKQVFRAGVFAHELLHKLLSDFKVIDSELKRFPESEQPILMQIINAMEDPAIEFFGSQEIGGDLIDSLRFTIAHIYKTSIPIQETGGAFNQFFCACIHFGDMGALKGYFTEPEALEAFRKAAPIIDKCIEEPSPSIRFKYAIDVFDITRPLWQDEANYNQLLNDLADMLEKMGKGTKPPQGEAIIVPKKSDNVGDGDGEKGANQGSSNLQKRLQKRRKNCLEKLSEGNSKESDDGSKTVSDSDSKSEKNQSRQNGNSTETTDKSDDKDDADGSSKGNGPEEDEENDSKDSNGAENGKDKGESDKNKDESKDDGNKEKENTDENSDDETGADDNGSDSSSSNNHQEDGSDEEKTNDCELPDIDKSGNIIESGETYADAEISEEEFEVSSSVINSLSQKFDEEKCVMEKSVDERITDDDKPLEVTITSPLFHGKIKCKNRIIQLPSDNMSLMSMETIYDIQKMKLNSLIKVLTNQLKRIFIEDIEERILKTTGRVDMKTMTTGKMTAKVFNKIKDPANKKNMAIAICIDHSGSMSGKKINAARDTAMLLAEVFGKLDIPIYVMGFSEGSNGEVHHNHYIRWNNSAKERLKLLNIDVSGCNFDGYSIRYITQILKRKRAEHKILIVIHDGAPASSHYAGSNGVTDTYNAVREAKKIASVLGVAVGNCHTDVIRTIYEKDFTHINNVDDLSVVLANLIKKIVSKWGN